MLRGLLCGPADGHPVGFIIVEGNTEVRLSELAYISNILSLTRVFLALPIYFFLEMRTPIGTGLAVGAMLLAGVTDAYDGRLARRLKQKSDLGRVLDPLADKICVGLIALALVRTRDLPLWFLGVTVFRDMGILVLGLFLVVKTRVVVESNILGKITVTALSFTLLVYTLDLALLKNPSLWLSCTLVLASSISYLKKLVAESRQAEP